MIYVDDTYPYSAKRGKFEKIESYTDGGDTWDVDFNPETRAYRVTRFIENHWCGDVVFNEVDTMSDEYKNSNFRALDAVEDIHKIVSLIEGASDVYKEERAYLYDKIRMILKNGGWLKQEEN